MKKATPFCIIFLTAVLAATLLPAASATVTAPAGGETLNSGAAYVIKWTHSSDLTAASLVRLQLFRGTTKVGEIQVNIPVTQKSYNWKVGEYVGGTAPAGADYRIRVKAMDATYADDSAAFSIQGGGSGGGLTITGPGVNPDTLKPKITVTNPHGGEVIAVTQTMNITWTRSGAMSDKVNISLQYGVMQTMQIANQVANSDSFSWTIPASVPPLNGQPKYRIFIQSRNLMGNKWVNARSEGFLIVAAVQPVHTKKLYELPATTNNKVLEHHWHASGANFYTDGPQETPDPGPGMARVGFQNWVSSGDDVTAHFLYRSWLGFNISSLPRNRTMVACSLNHAIAQVVHQNCPYTAIRFYVLTAPWNGDPMALFSIPTMEVNPGDLRAVIAGWVADPARNYGMIITGQDEIQAGYPKNVNSYIVYLNQLQLNVRYE